MSLGGNGSWRGSVPSSNPTAFLSHLSLSTDLGVAIFLILTGVVSVVGNGIVLLVYCRKKKKLRPPELMTINLAICDFGYSLLGAPCLNFQCVPWLGVWGFVFGIGSLITTCLISLDRCLKICSFRYGQWIEVVVLLSVLGLLACLRLRQLRTRTLWDQLHHQLVGDEVIFDRQALHLADPDHVLLSPHTDHRRLLHDHSADDSSCGVLHLPLILDSLCHWLPLLCLGPQGGALGQGGHAGRRPLHGDWRIHRDGLSLPKHPQLNWTSTENYGSVYYDPGESLRDVTNPDPYSYSGLGHSLSAASTRSSAPGQEGESETGSNRPVSCLPPMVSLIPAMFAKSHCMINPFIYQIMNKEFREDVYDILFGRQNGERRRMRGRAGSYSDSKVSFIATGAE